MSKRILAWAAILFLAAGTMGFARAAGPGPGPGNGTCDGTYCVPNPDCPDADGDGICNGQDPDYLPGSGHAECPDADGDGICNGQDPDFVRHSGVGRWSRILDTLSSMLSAIRL